MQLWVEERMALATSTDHGNNLQTVQMLIKKNQVQHQQTGRCSAGLPLCVTFVTSV